jgi:nitrile hydratase subunit beta
MAGASVQPRFAVGERVRVLALGKPGHVRTPDYVLGKVGEVVQYCGCFLNPEDLAVGHTNGPVVPLYRVRFAMSALWPEPPRRADDTLCIEIYDHWLSAETP